MRKFPFPRVTVDRLILEKGVEDVIRLHDNYVGKGERRSCIGFVAPEVRVVVQFLLELAGETEAEGVELEDLVVMAGTMCVDGMGKDDCIVYFPGYAKFEEPPSEEVVAVEDAPAPSPQLGQTFINSVNGPVTGSVFQIASLRGEVKDHR